MKELEKPTSEIDDRIDLMDCLIVLVKYSRMIIYTSIIIMVCTYLNLFIGPNQYLATVRIMPPQQNLSLSAQILSGLGASMTPGQSATGGGEGLAAGSLGLRSPGDLYVAVLGCDTISERMIDRFNWREKVPGKPLDDLRVLFRLAIRPYFTKEGLISVDAIDIDPKEAAAMANAMIEELDRLLREIGLREAKVRLAFLEKELQQVNLKLATAEQKLRTFAEQKGVIQIDSQTKGMLEYIASLRAQIDAKEVQIKVMQQQATPNNYDLIRLETEVKGLRQNLQDAESQWDSSRVGDVCLPTSKVPELGLEFLRLTREAKYQEGLFQFYTKMVEMSRLDMVRDLTVIQVVDQARPPEKRSNKRLLPSVLAGTITFFLMIFIAFGREYWHNASLREENSRRLALMRFYLEPWRQTFKRCLSIFKRRST